MGNIQCIQWPSLHFQIWSPLQSCCDGVVSFCVSMCSVSCFSFEIFILSGVMSLDYITTRKRTFRQHVSKDNRHRRLVSFWMLIRPLWHKEHQNSICCDMPPMILVICEVHSAHVLCIAWFKSVMYLYNIWL